MKKENNERPELDIDWEKEKAKSGYKDGRLKIFRETYRGLPYEIHVIYHKAYEDFDDDLKSDYDRGMWATLEQPKEMQDVYQKIEEALKEVGELEEDEGFCYADTAHDYNRGQDINQRIEKMRETAHRQIDAFYNYLEKSGSLVRGDKSLHEVLKEWVDKEE